MQSRSESVDWKAMYMAAIDNTLTDMVVPEGVEAFLIRMTNNSRLRSVTFPSTLKSIYNYNFVGMPSLNTPITIPAGVTRIGQQVFQSCLNIPYFVLEGTTPPQIFVNTFNSNPNTCLFYVPDSAVATYKAANMWSTYESRIFPISDMPTT